MSYSTPYLNQIVTVTMDRPLGSKHPRHGFTYEINYGYIKDVKAPDGDELDAYVIGEEDPLAEFTGRCIAIIHRSDDDDDKLVVCDGTKSYSDEEIRKFTNFQEQWFKSDIIRPEADQHLS